ncbi:MAG: Flp pilus assembly complex ATPase component TadA [Actinobacteria bacterium]|nr:Flp pilus assembly complex ATPase component TadA [Actinomycetota bacterium]
MGLSERIKSNGNGAVATTELAGHGGPLEQVVEHRAVADPYAELKTQIHHACIAKLGPQLFTTQTDEDLSERVLRAVTEQLALDRTPLTREERRQITKEITDDILGYGPLEPFLHDDTVTEVMVNGPDMIFPPLALRGPTLTIRKFSRDPYTMDDLIEFGSLSPKAAQFLSACVHGKLNILISGGTGTGKTTTLNAMSAFIPDAERIVTIEDAAELQLQQKHVITLEARPPNIEGEGEVRIRELVRNSLRMRPDRIIVGEVRGPETLDMLQAMNTGHEGSLTTIHANSPRDALSRLETLVMTAGVELPHRAIREQIASAFDLLIQISRLVDGSRRITHVSEVLGMESDVITLQDVFVAKPPDERDQGEASGASRLLDELRCTGLKPHFLEKMAANGVVMPANFFNEDSTGYVGFTNANYGSYS